MQLNRSYIERSPSRPENVRLSGDVTYDDPHRDPYTLWFEVPATYGEYLSTTGNPWLVALLPMAMVLNEPLRIGVPVDRMLFDNMPRLQTIWKTWYPYLHRVAIEAEVYDAPTDGPIDSSPARRTVSFFSGGADSCFTLLSHQDHLFGSQSLDIDELLFVKGFDIALDETDALQWASNTLTQLARSFDKALLFVTWGDLRQMHYFKIVEWGRLGHGSMLAATALALEKRYKCAVIPSSWPDLEMIHWGSHPDTDPLFSATHMQIVHDTTTVTRTQKTEYIAQYEAILTSLRVCWSSPTGGNCSCCEKCYRTMLALDICGVLDRATTFDITHWNLAVIRDLEFTGSRDFISWRDLLEFARRRNRTDVVDVLADKLRKTRVLEMRLKMTEYLNWQPAWLWLVRKRRNVRNKIGSFAKHLRHA